MRMFVGALSTVFLVAQASSPAFAQGPNIPDYPEKKSGREAEASHWRPGVQGGLNVSDYTNIPNVGSSTRVGYILGAELEYRVTPVFFLQQELRVVQKGFSYNLNTGGSVTNFDSRIEYLEIPFLVKAKFMQGSIVQPFVFFGPNLGFNIGNNVDVLSGGNLVSGPALEVLFKTVDFAVDGGVGGEYHFARKMAGFLEFRASIGLVNVSDLAGTNWKSRNYQFIFGGLFDL